MALCQPTLPRPPLLRPDSVTMSACRPLTSACSWYSSLERGGALQAKGVPESSSAGAWSQLALCHVHHMSASLCCGTLAHRRIYASV